MFTYFGRDIIFSVDFLWKKEAVNVGGVNMSLDYNKKNINLAKNLRKNATLQENHL